MFSKKLNNSQTLKFIKPSTDSKNSQTLIKKYDYDLNKVKKANSNLTEPLNSLGNFKNTSSKNFFPYKIGKIHNKMKAKNNTMKFLLRKSNSYKTIKLYRSIEYNEKEIKPFFISKHYKYKLRKKLSKKNLSQINNYKGRKNLEKIGNEFLNYSNTYFNKSNKNIIDNYENKKESNNKNKSILNNYINNDPWKIKRKTFLRNSILNLKHKNNNNIITKDNNNMMLLKEKANKTNWKNKILNDVIININKNIYQNAISKNMDSSGNNYHFLHKFRISTLLNVYNNNSISYKLKSL